MASRAPAPAPRKPLKPITSVGPIVGNTLNRDWVSSSDTATLSGGKLGLSLVGGRDLKGTGNDGGTSRQNTLTAASHTGNSSLIAGTASTTMIGGSGNNYMDATKSQGIVSLKGGSGNSTMYASNGLATLLGGGQNNYLKAGVSSRSLGQSLVGGTSTSSLYGNKLYGGTGADTLRSGSGYNTLVSGSTATVAAINVRTAPSLSLPTITIGTAAKSRSKTISVTNAAGLAVGQVISGRGIAVGTTITAILGKKITLSAAAAALSKNSTLSVVSQSAGSQKLSLASSEGLKVGQLITGNGIVEGTSISAISGNIITLSAKTTAPLSSGAGFSVIHATGSQTLSLDNTTGLSVGQMITGNGIAEGTSIMAILGNTITLSTRTTAPITSGSRLSVISQVLIGGGLSNSLVSGSGNDSLTALGGNSTLIGGIGQTTLVGAGAGTKNWLQSGYSLVAGSGGNTLIGGAGSNTLIAGSTGSDSIIGGANQNLLLVTEENRRSIANDTINFSTLPSAQNTLGVSLSAGASLGDAEFRGTFADTARNISTLKNLTATAARIELGGLSETIGVRSLISGTGRDTLSVAGYSVGAYLDAALSSSRASLVGSTVLGASGDTFRGSSDGFDTISGSTGNDLIILQNPLGTSSISGGSGTDTLRMDRNAAFDFRTFNALSGVEVLSLAGGTSLQSGVNSVGALQGSGIRTIIGGQGVNSDVISASCAANVQSLTAKDSFTLILSVPPGASGTMGFEMGQFISGNGIAPGTMIREVSPSTGFVTLTLSNKTSAQVAQGTLINGWFNNFVIDGSGSTGQLAKQAATNEVLARLLELSNTSNGLYEENKGLPNELGLGVQTFLGFQNDPITYIRRQGDSLVTGGHGNLVKGAISTAPDALIGGGNLVFTDSYGNKQSGIRFNSHVVTDNTIVSGMFNVSTPTVAEAASQGANTITLSSASGLAVGQNLSGTGIETLTTITSINGNIITLSKTTTDDLPLGTSITALFASNTLVGGPGHNLYLLNNLPGDTLLPFIQMPENSTLQSGSTLQFTGNSVRLDDPSFAQVGAKTAQVIKTANGNNLIQIGTTASPIGIRSIVGGVGSDTFTTRDDYAPSVYLDASSNGGNSSLASGLGNDTLLGGAGSSTLLGRDGNNSLVGGNGYNLIKSGVGTSTLDSGYGISTLQADGGTNTFIVRNRWTRILEPDTQNPQTATIPLVGIVNTYVNFDPILGSPVSQFDPGIPDNSPSITKSPSFASSDLSSFYNLQYFNLLGSANYGVGNALDNTISAGAANALILGMGGNNTLVSSGTGSSLYGNSNTNYASPDLYAVAPTDTRTQAFIDGVMGVAGNNSLIASGANSYLDGGSGYDDGLFNGSGANTLIGTGGNSTVIVSHQADHVSLTGASNTVITSVDLYRAPDNVSEIILNVTPQIANSGQVSFNGQRMTAGYAAMADAKGGYTDTYSHSLDNNAPDISLSQATRIQVAYGAASGAIYQEEGGSLTVTPNNQDYELSWTSPTDSDQQTLGYLVNYQVVATHKTTNAIFKSPELTYLNGTSQDLTGTPDNPKLLVINLPASFTDGYGTTYDSTNYNITYSFKVTAQQTVLPAYTDADGNLIAKPVSLIGGHGNDVLSGGLLDNISNTRPVLTNNPNPLDNLSGVIPAPYGIGNAPSDTISGLFPTYLSGGLSGDDLLIAPIINNGSGQQFTAYQYIDGVRRAVTYSGLNTLEGGLGSDTFIVTNGGKSLNAAYDNIIKYGSETPTGEHNLVVSYVDFLTLSDTVVNQGKFISQAWAAEGGQYIGGNRLDNSLTGYGGSNTLLGAGGRDIIRGSGVLIGGTAYGLDSISGALADYDKGQTDSIYRDTDPVPVGVNDPGSADNSQYWMVNGGYDALRNSDTLGGGGILDGGAGKDSMVGSTGNDTIYVSNGSNSNAQSISASDIVEGGGGNDWIVFTGSDTYWSGSLGATTAVLGYVLSNNGDADDGLSISNIKLQDGSPVARFAIGNSTSEGIQRRNDEAGSNHLIGNEQNNNLNGGGVGGSDQTGTGIDTLTGGGGADLFVIQGQYTSSDFSGGNTDVDYAIITDFTAEDRLQTGNAASGYLIGPTPSRALGVNNVLASGNDATTTSFGIYTSSRDLVAVINTADGFELNRTDLTNPVGGTNYLFNVVGTRFENRMI